MTKYIVFLRRARHAGVRWTIRAIFRRGMRRVEALPAIRARIDRKLQVTPESFKGAIDFGSAPIGDLKARFIDNPAAQHFLDQPQAVADRVKTVFPDNVRATLQEADKLCRHEFSFLGRDVAFGDEIDWHWMPDGDGSWPNRHVDGYPKSSYYGEDRPGDIKYPWELGRHQYFVTLGKAYRYTGDERYAEEFTRQLIHWRETNPLRHGIHWISEMEFGIRIISWTNAFQLFKSSPYFQQHGLEPFLLGLYEHALYLDRTLTTHWLVANNHLLGESAGLFAFAVLFPQFRESAGWQRKALRVFADALGSQIFPDGVNKEQATGYHRFVLDFVWLVVRLGEANTIKLPKIVYERMERMLEYECAIIPPNGIVPQIGDCDDGRAFILSETDPFFDFRGWQAAGAVQFNRPDFARAAEGGNEEALWLLGADAWERFKSMTPDNNARQSVCFKGGGHSVLRTGDGADDTYVFVRCGEYGLGGSGSCVHSHADILAPIIHWQGIPLTVDAGTYAYYCPTAERDRLRSTSVHNTMAPLDVEQATMMPIFNWETIPQAEITEWTTRDGATSFSGRLTVENGFTHVRKIELNAQPRELLIEDSLTLAKADERNAFVWRMLFHQDITVSVENETDIVLSHNDIFRIRVHHNGFDECRVREFGYSPSYGIHHQGSMLELVVAPANEAETSVTFRSVE